MPTIDRSNMLHSPKYSASEVKRQSNSLYTIDNAATHERSVSGSAFPRKVRPFTEPISATKDIVIPRHTDCPSLIRAFYKGATPYAIQNRWGFLDRHNKERIYEPQIADRFVFRGTSSIKEFKDSAHRLIAQLTSSWKSLGYSTKQDPDRGIEIPDTASLLTDDTFIASLRTMPKAKLDSIYFIVGNLDIMLKSCIVRTVSAGWWAVSYSGKKAEDMQFFKRSIEAHRTAFKRIVSSPKFNALYSKFWAEASDPITTNPGYPFYSTDMSAEGHPITRIKTVELFKNLGAIKSWPDLIQTVDDRAGKFGLPGHPFAVAPIIRLQPGYKWGHQFDITAAGMRTAYDSRGFNSQRVAHMVPYTYNMLTSPVATAYKAIRFLLPGAYHDREAKAKRMKKLNEQSIQGKLYLMEADYSNFDRFMATDIIDAVTTGVLDALELSDSVRPMMRYLHQDASLLWPDYSSISTGNGWVFKPGELGLLSGVKLTSEMGTLVNSVINLQVVANAYKWTDDQMISYLTTYLTAEPGSKQEYYYIMSDDSLLITADPDKLPVLAEQFRIAVAKAGLKGDVALADRFLMRLMQSGCDRPVPARVFQNTLSNETPPDDPFVFLVGLANRTDGMFGVKTVDPFNTATYQAITDVEAKFTQEVCSELKRFVSTSASPIKEAEAILDVLLTLSPRVTEVTGRYVQIDKANVPRLHSLRQNAARALAEQELSKANSKGLMTSYIESLLRDKNIPSSQLMLDQLLTLAPSLNNAVNVIAGKESAFFKYASQTMGVKSLSV